jgi:hypothetical protein
MIKIMNIPSCPNSLSVPSCEIIYSFGSHECEEFLLSQSVAVANLCVPVTLFTHAHENLFYSKIMVIIGYGRLVLHQRSISHG